LRKGELSGQQIKTPQYSEKKFREILPEIKLLMARHSRSPFTQVQDLCFETGVKLVHTPCLYTPISGATRWINNNPLIQLSKVEKREDQFWLSFFHEAGHIILHGKKEIFLEEKSFKEKELIKEKEADSFAIKWIG